MTKLDNTQVQRKEVYDPADSSTLVRCHACEWWTMCVGEDHEREGWKKGMLHYEACPFRKIRRPRYRTVWESLPDEDSVGLNVKTLMEINGVGKTQHSQVLNTLELAGLAQYTLGPGEKGSARYWRKTGTPMPTTKIPMRWGS